MGNPQGITAIFPGSATALFTKVLVSKTTFLGDPVEMLPTLAVWATGAHNSCITPAVVKELGLRPFQKALVQTAEGEALLDVYQVCIHLSNDMMIDIPVTEVPSLGDEYEVLIGMNIIRLGEFAVRNFDGQMQMTFRMPSAGLADYA